MKNKLTPLFAALLAVLFTCGTAAAQQADSLRTATIRVGNLHCNGDMPTIKKKLLNQDGVDEVRFSEREDELSTFTVTYHSAVTSLESIEKTIEATPGCDDQSETPYRVRRERPAKKKRP